MDTKKKILGVKFFQRNLDLLKLYQFEYVDNERSNTLPASSIVTYILYHYHCDEYGRIVAEEFCLKRLAEKYNLPYTSLHNGHHLLHKLDLIKSVHIHGQEFYEISGYAECNDIERNQGNLNYFILPYFIIQSGELAHFIRQRDANGLLGLLTLLNSLYRSVQRNGKESVVQRLSTTLMNGMKKTTRNILSWIKRVSAFFHFVEQEGITRREKKWVIKLADECFEKVNQDSKFTSLFVKIKKDITSSFTQSRLHYNSKDISDVMKAAKQDLIQIFYPINDSKGNRKLYEIVIKSHTQAFEELLDRINSIDTPLESIGAYYRTVLRSIVKEHWEKSLDEEDRMDIFHYFQLKNRYLPKFLSIN